MVLGDGEEFLIVRGRLLNLADPVMQKILDQ